MRAWADRSLLYARTARHLRPAQIAHRSLRKLQSILPFPSEDDGFPFGFEAERWSNLREVLQGWGPLDPTATLACAENVVAGRFDFVGTRLHLTEIDWHGRYRSHLWSYHLHYFDYGRDLAWAYQETADPRFLQAFQHLAEDWIEHAKPGRGDGWSPYPLSLRVVNWIYAALLFGTSLEEPFSTRLLGSIHRQLRWLERHLELDLLANHLIKNLKALTIGGLAFQDEAADRWRKEAVPHLWRQVLEQVLPDGAHFERSPMYHAIVLADLLEVLDLMRGASEEVPKAVVERVDRMIEAMGVLCRPDGTLHLFNDSAQNFAPSRRWLDGMSILIRGKSIPLEGGSVHLGHGSFFGFVDADSGARLVIDAGEPRPSYQPGHAHCGALGFELDLYGESVVVDSGVSGYDGDPLREYVRSTRAHSTVMIDGKEQSEVWATFRMGRRTRVRFAQQRFTPIDYQFVGECVPYHDRRARHLRTIERDSSGAYAINDQVIGARGKRITSFLHLHPDCDLEREGEVLHVRRGPLTFSVRIHGVDRWQIVQGQREPAQGWYCPQFGLRIPAPAVVMEIDHNDERQFGYAFEDVRLD